MKNPALQTNLKKLQFKLRHKLFILERKWQCDPFFHRFYPKKAAFKRLLTIALALLIFIPGMLIFFQPEKAKAEWFDDNYAYRQKFSFTDNTGYSTPRRITFTLNTQNLVSNGAMQSNCADIRFTDINGKLLRFNLTGTCNAGSTTFDVVFQTIITGTNANVGYVYYGNPRAVSASQIVSDVTALTPSGGAPANPNRSNEEQAPSPALFLMFDEGYGWTTMDSSQNKNNGGIRGTSWKTNEYCVIGNCLQFDGIDDTIIATNAASIDFDTGLATASAFQAWVRPNSNLSGENTAGKIFSKGTNTWLKITNTANGKADLQASFDLATDATLTAAQAIDLDRWNHVAMTQSGTTIKVFVNGILKATSTNGAGAKPADTSDLLIGGSNGAHFKGFIDEFKIYPYERTNDQLKTDLSTPASLHGTSASVADDRAYLSNDLLGYWKLDESSGNASDSSGNGYNLTNNNTTPYNTGKFGNAPTFNGSNRYFSAGSTITGVQSISFWAKPSSTTENYIHLASGIYINSTSGTISATGFTNPKIYVNGYQTNTVTASTWQLITITTTTPISASAFEIGRANSSVAGNNSQIDDVRLYKRTLSEPDISRLYDWEPTPVGWWKLDENTGNAFDSSGSEITLTNNNSTNFTTGKFGKAAQFNADNSNYFSTTTAISGINSISFWVNPTTTTDEFINLEGTGIAEPWCDDTSGITCTTAWGARRKITFDNTASSENLTNFPVMIRLTSSNIDFAKTQSAGQDIRFVDPDDNTNVLPHEIEKWDESGNEAIVWVKVPQLNSGSTTDYIWMYYDNNAIGDGQDASNVWNGNSASSTDDYEAVYHFKTSPSTTCSGSFEVCDSTGNANHGDAFNTPASITGNIGLGMDIDFNSSEYVQVAHEFNSTDVTFELWVNRFDLLNPGFILNKFQNASNGWGIRATANEYFAQIWDDILNNDANIYTTDHGSGWHHLVAIIDNTENKFYVDGQLVGSGISTLSGSTLATFTGNFYMGSRGGTTDFFNGQMDEVRISDHARSADWIEAAYENTKSGSTFTSFSAEDTDQGTSTKYISASAGSLSFIGATSPTLYVNGVTNGNLTANTWNHVYVSSNTALTANNFKIGQANSAYSDSKIDDVRLYNYALTPKQIVSIMNADHPSVGSPVGSPVAKYNFDEGYGTTAHDNSVNTNDLTLSTANAAWLNDGKFGKAWHGYSGNWLSRSDDDDFDFSTTDDFTISTWFRSASPANPGATQYLVDKYGGSQGYALYATTTGTVCIGIDDDASFNPDTSACSTTDIYDQNWHHLLAARNVTQDTLSLYVDGKLAQSSTDTTTATLANSTTLYIGDDDADTTNSLTGELDDLKFYRYALSADEVKLDYNQGKSIVLGAASTQSDNRTASNSAAAAYCPPGNTATCNAPIAHWPLDERQGTIANDISGNANTGTLTNSPKWTTGKIGQALKFNGADNYVSIADAAVLESQTNMTVSAWVKMDRATGTERAILEKDHSISPWQSWKLNIKDDETASFVLANTAGSYFGAVTTFPIPIGEWHHLVGVKEGNAIRIYYDGSDIDTNTSTFTGSLVDSDSPLLLGAADTFGTANLPGQIDDVRIYNYARTPAQIAWEYNRGAPIAHYKLDECTGSTAHDASKNRFDGTITIGATGSQASAGNCATVDTTAAWYNGRNGKYGSSLNFDGTDDYIQTTDNTNLRFDENTRDFSLFAWVKRATTGTEYIISKEDADDDGYRLMFNASNQVVCSEDATDVTSTSSISDTNWHLIGCTIDRDGNGQVYIDAVANGSATAMGSDAMATTSNIRIGTRSYTSTNYFNGQIDDARIYNYPLTPAQIRTVYNEGSAVRFGPVTGSP